METKGRANEPDFPSIYQLVEQGRIDELAEFLEGQEEGVIVGERDGNGRTVLELAVILGRDKIATLLVEKGADVNQTNVSGYSSLHDAAAWGHLQCLKALIVSGASHQLRTRHNETARDIAARYKQMSCVDYLDRVDAKFQLTEVVQQARNLLTDTERITGKWNKDDKSKVTVICNEKALWLSSNPDPSLEAIQAQRKDFDQRFQPHLAKLPPPTEP